MASRVPTTCTPRVKNRSTTSIASMSGMALRMARRNRSPGGLGSRPRGAASSAAETRAWSTGYASWRARVTHWVHSPARSIAGTTTAAFARPTCATAARTAPRSGSVNAQSMRPIARRL